MRRLSLTLIVGSLIALGTAGAAVGHGVPGIGLGEQEHKLIHLGQESCVSENHPFPPPEEVFGGAAPPDALGEPPQSDASSNTCGAD